MSNEHEIETVLDFLKLSEDEFKRMLPDLTTWYLLSKELEKLGAEVASFTWVDDGKEGEIHSFEVTNKTTGETVIVKGSAYSDANEGAA